MLNVEEKELRAPQSFTLRPSTVTTIKSLAKVYNTNASRIVEALVTQYGLKILAQKGEEKQ